MTTINAVGNGLSGATGTGSFSGSASPTYTTQISTPKIIFNAASNGIAGITNGTAANSGYVREISTSIVAYGSAVAISNNVINVTSIPLTAGLWRINGNVTAENTFGVIGAWISTTSATLPDASLYAYINGYAVGSYQSCVCPAKYLNLSTTTTVYLSASSTGTGIVCGGIYVLRVA